MCVPDVNGPRELTVKTHASFLGILRYIRGEGLRWARNVSGYPRGTRVASRAESATVNACGLVQGIALVTFPAASTIFTSRSAYDLSSSQYGALFVPQMSTAIVASLLGAGLLWPGLTRRAGEKTICVAGLLADLASMVLLIASWLVVHQHAAAFALLLVATACLGAGGLLRTPAAPGVWLHRAVILTRRAAAGSCLDSA